MRLGCSVFLSCLVMASPGTALSQEFTGREHAYAMLLLSQSDTDVRTAARVLYKAGSRNQNTFDLLAEVTWTACSGNRTMDADTLSWLGKTLGNTAQSRYAGLLDYCLSTIKDEKTKKYMKQARDKIAGPPASNTFEGGKMDLGEMRARVAKQGDAVLRPRLADKFADLREGQEIEEVYSTLGPPNEVSRSSIPGGSVGYGVVKVRTGHDVLVLGYGNLGTIRLVYRENENDWRLVNATSTKGLFWSANEGRFVPIDDRIARGNGSQLREIAAYLIERGTLNKDILDRAADRIHESRQEQNEQVADGLAWLCKVIAKGRDGRYKPFLLDVSNTAASEKLRKYARESATGLAEVSGGQYIPVSGQTR